MLFARVTTHRVGPLTLDLPDLATVQWAPALLAAIAAVLIFRLRLGLIKVLGVMMVLGLGVSAAGL